MSLTRSKAILELGKRLVSQLDVNNDLLAAWMAHYVAQRIEAAEKAPPEDQSVAQAACANAILELWRYRSSLPDHLRPFRDLEPILRTLAFLDVDRADFHYYPAALREAATADADEDVKQWIELAIGLDYSARLLIQSALRSAAYRGAAQAEPWVELARRAGADEGAERAIVKFVRAGDEDTEVDASGTDAELLDRLSRLESFAELALVIAKDIRTELGLKDTEEE